MVFPDTSDFYIFLEVLESISQQPSRLLLFFNLSCFQTSLVKKKTTAAISFFIFPAAASALGPPIPSWPGTEGAASAGRRSAAMSAASLVWCVRFPRRRAAERALRGRADAKAYPFENVHSSR